MSLNIPSIASVSAYQQALVAQQVNIATLTKANDAAKAQGEAVVALLQSAVDVATQSSQTRAANGQLDVTA